jgi:large subunit ribosomal protein L3
MTIGLVGRKVGMTRIFTDEGGTLPVTVLDVSDNRITQIKTAETDGYAAVQVAFGKRRASRVRKPIAGHLAKAAVEAGHMLREFRAKADELANLKVGGKIGVEIFKVGQKVDVQGITIGKGFAGVIKRHHFSSNRASHGNSISHNKPGSTGQNQSPGRVFPGKRMAGHLGDKRRTILNLEVVRVDAERQLLLVKGSVPGSSGRDVIVRPAIKITKAAGPSGQKQPKAEAKSAAKPAGAAAKPAAAPAKPAAQPAKPAPAAKS